MGTNRKELARGLKYELETLPLLIIAPVPVTMGFKAIKQYNNNVLLIIGILLAVTAVILEIKIILNAFFDKN